MQAMEVVCTSSKASTCSGVVSVGVCSAVYGSVPICGCRHASSDKLRGAEGAGLGRRRGKNNIGMFITKGFKYTVYFTDKLLRNKCKISTSAYPKIELSYR